HAGLFGKFTIKDEVELGKKFSTLIKSKLPLAEDPEIVDYVKDVTERLHSAMPPIPFNLETSVVRNNALNAFAAPAGYVFVFTGLIHHLEHESEMAGVIAHELGHVSQRHIAHRIENMQLVSLGTLAGVVAGVFLGQGTGDSGQAGEALIAGSIVGGHSAMLKYSREDEHEADQVGMNTLVAAGYPPSGLVGAFKKIRRQKWLGGGGIPTYLSTHPGIEERIGYMEDRIPLLPPEIQNRKNDDARFLRIQTLVRARYLDPETALPYFRGPEGVPSSLDYLGQGIAYARLNKISAAGEAFENALALAPNDPLILREAGRFHYKRGDLDLAGKCLQKAAMLNPRDLMALFYYARLLGEKGETGPAASYFERVLRKIPEDGEVHYHLGRLLGEAGHLFEAHLHLAYGALYGLDKKQTEFHRDRARGLAKTEEQKQKLNDFEKKFKERSEFW
ncbi:MAG: M48 family metalloprotease, partial [Thermodesulfobacteriota bacterium]|nr:M48 family metalloprotease [Thermodesulfobacteriota bacterium]